MIARDACTRQVRMLQQTQCKRQHDVVTRMVTCAAECWRVLRRGDTEKPQQAAAAAQTGTIPHADTNRLPARHFVSASSGSELGCSTHVG